MGPVKARGSFRMVVNRLYYGQHDLPTPFRGKGGSPLNTATHAIGISADTLAEVLQSIYQREFNPKADIEPNLFRAIAGQLTEAVNEGAAPTLGSDPMLHALRHSADVFSAFKTHRTQNDMAALLLDENGNLKPFERWQNDVQPIARHQCRSWLETEYNTAVLRARQAADWQQFEAEKDVLPNLKWLPSTSPNPGADHMPFWNTILPIDHPFWNQHRPGDRWNCKCELTSTAEPPTAAPDVPDGKGSDPQRGLKGNPGKTQAVFSQDHPYFPSDCRHCPFYKPSPIARLRHIFQNHEKNCMGNCPYIDRAIDTATDGEKQRIKANREEFKRYLNDPDYKDVKFNKKTGGVKATHIEHCFDKKTGWYEKKSQSAGFKAGHSVILEKEPQNIYKKKSCEGLWDHLPFEIAGAETGTANNIRNALKHCVKKPDAKIAVLYFPNDNFNIWRFHEGLAKFNGLAGTSQYRLFDLIYCICGEDIVLIKKPSA